MPALSIFACTRSGSLPPLMFIVVLRNALHPWSALESLQTSR
jgi:hypothetical protein